MLKKVLLTMVTVGALLVPSDLVMADSLQMGNGIEDKQIETREDKIEWVFKIVNGKAYKRLYNFSKEEWLTDWILC